VSGLYTFEIATILYNKSLSFNTNTNQASKWKAKEALELCDVVIEKFPKSQAAIKCRNLKQRIYEETLSIRTESYIPNQKYSKVLVTYKNISILNFKIYSISNKNIEKLNNVWDEEEQLKIIKSLTELKNWQERLKNENDYQQHSIEVKIPKLENNRYLIYAENHNKTFAFSFLNVTDFALVDKSMKSKIIYQVINRNNGKPIENATVKVSYKNNYRSKVHSFTKTTNVNGEIAFQKSNKRKTSINVQVSKDGEKAHFGEFYVNRIYSENKDKKEITYNSFLFTDRSIYRPGQTVYFKGIVITTENKKSKVAEGETVFATLYDANNQKLTEMDFETNEFGSFHGELLLPNSGLNGQYRIETFITGVSKKSTYISVEEYKRPKFEAKFKPVTETYKIDDSITVKGNAIAFAGSSITDAKVVYRVERKIEFPRWFYWHRPSYFSEQQEITHGETTTDASGNFEITFKALADKSIDKNNLPIFKYVVTADVTDVNGETRSASTIVNIGYHALIATINIDGKIDKSNKENRLTIDTKNLNGEFVPATGTVKIYKLKAPETVVRSRPWSAPDYKAFSKEEYNTLFPHEAYHNEDKSKNWEKGKLVFEKEFDSEKSKTIDLKNIKKWESGQYRIELESKDKFGQNVKDIAETTLFSTKEKTLPDKQLFNIKTDKSKYKVGETVNLEIGSSAKDITVFVIVEKNHKIVEKHKTQLNNNIKTLNIPVTKDDVGGFAIQFSYAVFNQFKHGRISVKVPYPKTDLDIETSTFRDKLQPGTEETWRFKIKGPKGEKVSAEILASMYDASLDQFKSHQWQFNPINLPTYYSQYRINGNRSFKTNNFRVHNAYTFNYINSNQTYDVINWFGLTLGNARWIRTQYLRSLNAKKSSVTSSNNSDIKEGFIKGVVLDEDGLALPGTTIIVEGTTRGVSSDFDGEFLIEAKKDDILKISYVGFSNARYTVGNNNYLTIVLASDAELDEVVVVGYGSSKRKDSTIAASVAKIEEIEEGVTLNMLSDSEQNKTTTVRGNGFIDASNPPLYIVDGKVVEDISDLDPNEIESINVLKGNDATA
ncbi:MAG: carboxypeptidase-like regulatory domain-containing protein, partial [Bacteroidia bacterium]|nr:carboxypeptidase-like regulatory domain-containing protein [Bacteroidia bacterium]